MSYTSVGSCSICGGQVTLPLSWMGIHPPVPTCRSCGATAAPAGPVIPMVPAPQRQVPQVAPVVPTARSVFADVPCAVCGQKCGDHTVAEVRACIEVAKSDVFRRSGTAEVTRG